MTRAVSHSCSIQKILMTWRLEHVKRNPENDTVPNTVAISHSLFLFFVPEIPLVDIS